MQVVSREAEPGKGHLRGKFGELFGKSAGDQALVPESNLKVGMQKHGVFLMKKRRTNNRNLSIPFSF